MFELLWYKDDIVPAIAEAVDAFLEKHGYMPSTVAVRNDDYDSSIAVRLKAEEDIDINVGYRGGISKKYFCLYPVVLKRRPVVLMVERIPV